jgi:general stress protein YciG
MRKDPNAVALGRKGGKARLTKMTKEKRQEIARKAVNARWVKWRSLKSGSLGGHSHKRPASE